MSSTVQFAYRPDLDLFTARWLSLTSGSTERGEYEALLRAPEALGTPHWLLDVRRRPTTTPEAARWVTTDWLPRAAALLRPARLRLAFLVPPVRAENLRADPALHAIMSAAYAPGHPFDLRTFTDEGAAVAWLLGQLE
ncbi:hypothetical protein [Hymenobacter properus]|uniref:STAS/SEC14 domain-containing protein n=1 Tax=Hymenobacter properus TaxID=2791026 RepID=A0A931BJ47_9BACT|nr:hypothetical protein [Hymenobacter properus]MBF9141153.1 hypothetical protein [Hymenobacter properus]MBR7719962.1 hypothetical protein [Microvirga sp. SRT04]